MKTPRLRALGFDLLEYLFERLRMVFGKTSENFTIKGDTEFFETGDEFAVGEAFGPRGDPDTYLKEPTEIVFLVAAVRKGISPGMGDRLTCLAFFATAAEAVAFDLREDIVSAFESCGSSFNSWHGK